MNLFNLFNKKNNKKIKKCTCATDKYMEKVKNGQIEFDLREFNYLAKCSEENSILNSYLCSCQPERLNEKTSQEDAKV